jgi:hypothetical protein
MSVVRETQPSHLSWTEAEAEAEAEAAGRAHGPRKLLDDQHQITDGRQKEPAIGVNSKGATRRGHRETGGQGLLCGMDGWADE